MNVVRVVQNYDNCYYMIAEVEVDDDLAACVMVVIASDTLVHDAAVLDHIGL